MIVLHPKQRQKQSSPHQDQPTQDHILRKAGQNHNKASKPLENDYAKGHTLNHHSRSIRLNILSRKKAHNVILVDVVLNIDYPDPQISRPKYQNKWISDTEQQNYSKASHQHRVLISIKEVVRDIGLVSFSFADRS